MTSVIRVGISGWRYAGRRGAFLWQLPPTLRLDRSGPGRYVYFDNDMLIRVPYDAIQLLERLR